MSGNHIITSSESIQPFVTGKVNGHEMMMEMESEKFIRTPQKECGRMYAIFYAPSKGFIKSISVAM
jgi:hypothetical protein